MSDQPNKQNQTNLERRDIIKGLATVPVLAFSWQTSGGK